MKVEKLIGLLGREIDEKVLSRDELLNRILAVSEELRVLEREHEVVESLAVRFGLTAGEMDPAAKKEDPHRVAEVRPNKTLQVNWPVGSHYQKQFKVKSREAWAYYKLGSADWYLATLSEISENVKKLDRLVGIEMAIDGTVQALCATFDAAVYALLSALESGANRPKDQRTPQHRASWLTLVELAETYGAKLLSAPDVFSALAAEEGEPPSGWMAQLMLLRQRSSRHDLLIRHWVVGSEAPVVCIDVPGREPQPPLAYLLEVRDLVEQLLKSMFEDLEQLRRRRDYPTADQPGPTESGLPDLLRRAGITTPY